MEGKKKYKYFILKIFFLFFFLFIFFLTPCPLCAPVTNDINYRKRFTVFSFSPKPFGGRYTLLYTLIVVVVERRIGQDRETRSRDSARCTCVSVCVHIIMFTEKYCLHDGLCFGSFFKYNFFFLSYHQHRSNNKSLHFVIFGAH